MLKITFKKLFNKKILSTLTAIIIISGFFVASSALAASEDIAQINFTTSPQTINKNVVSAILTTQTQNAGGTEEQVDEQGTKLNLISSSGTGEFSTSSANWISVTILGMAKNTANRNFYYRDSTAGIHTLTITAQGKTWTPATQDITIFNNPPVLGAIGDKTINEFTTLTFTASSTDIDGDIPTYSLTNAPARAGIASSTGVFSWTPTEDQGPGSYIFDVIVSDGNKTDSETITITVNEVNVAPIADSQAVVTDEDTAKVITLIATDVDLPANTLIYTVVCPPAHGVLTGIAPALTYTPELNYNGVDSFTFKANDGAVDSNTATVSITINPINDTPVAIGSNVSVAKNKTKVITLIATDIDLPADVLTYSLVATSAHGTAVLSDNQVTYTPDIDYDGLDSFTFMANDGTVDSNTATVNITVVVNNAPVAVEDDYSVNEDETLTVPAPGILGNDTDTDADIGDSLTAVKITDPIHGILTLNADGSFVYAPTANYNGVDSFNYKATDGMDDSNIFTVTITVNAVNDAPVAVNDNYIVNEDETLTVSASGVLGNDTDVDGDSLTAIKATDPFHGTVTIDADGSFIYIPSVDYNGSDSFTYRVSDGIDDNSIATVCLTITPVNDAPVAVNDNYSVNEDTTLIVVPASGVLGNDTDADIGDSLTATNDTDPSHGVLTLNADGSFIYTPTANYNGVDSFIYKATDGMDDSNIFTVTITVNAVNDVPILGAIGDKTIDELATLTFTATSTDIDGGVPVYSLINAPAGAEIASSTGVFSWTATEAQGPGSYPITIQVSDGQAIDSEAITITVNEVNTAPIANGQSIATDENTAKAITLTATDTDLPVNILTWTVLVNPAHGSLTGVAPNLTYTPTANYSGSDFFTFKVNDGFIDSNVATSSLTINPAPHGGGGGGGGYTPPTPPTPIITIPTQLKVLQPKILGVKNYADKTLLRSKDKKIYIIINDQKKRILNLQELAMYAGQKIYDAENAILDQYSEVLGIKVFPDNTLIRGNDKKIYVIQKGKKQHIKNLMELRQKYFGKKIYNE